RLLVGRARGREVVGEPVRALHGVGREVDARGDLLLDDVAVPLGVAGRQADVLVEHERARPRERQALLVPPRELVVDGERRRAGGQPEHRVGLRPQQVLDGPGGQPRELVGGCDDDLHQLLLPSTAAPTAATGTCVGASLTRSASRSDPRNAETLACSRSASCTTSSSSAPSWATPPPSTTCRTSVVSTSRRTAEATASANRSRTSIASWSPARAASNSSTGAGLPCRAGHAASSACPRRTARGSPAARTGTRVRADRPGCARSRPPRRSRRGAARRRARGPRRARYRARGRRGP